MIVDSVPSMSDKDVNPYPKGPMRTKPHSSKILADNAFQTEMGLNCDRLLPQTYHSKPLFSNALYDKNAVISILANSNGQSTQHDVCLMTEVCTLGGAMQTRPSPEVKLSIQSWLDSVDPHPYVPPECSSAVGFFANLQSLWRACRADPGRGLEADLPSASPLAGEAAASIGRGRWRACSSPPCEDSSPLEDPSSITDSPKGLASSSDIDNNAHASYAADTTTTSPSLRRSKPFPVVDLKLRSWDFFPKEVPETKSEIDKLWTDTPVFASCFFSKHEHHFSERALWSSEHFMTLPRRFGELEKPPSLPSSHGPDDVGKEAAGSGVGVS